MAEAKTFDPENPPDVPEGISKKSMKEMPFSLALADARMDDNPLVYVNEAFCRISGYTANSVLGRNCRFLQGEDTDEGDRRVIRNALEEGRDITLDILNYRSDGQKFVNRLMITPLRDDDGEITHFLGIQNECEVDNTYADRASRLDESLRETQHRVKNHLSMLLALIRMEAKQSRDTKHALEVLANRVEALNLLYSDFAQTARDGQRMTVGLGAYITRVCSALNMLDGLREVRMNLDTEEFECTVDAASQIGLLVSELLTNSLQHAFESGTTGSVEVRLRRTGDQVCLEVRDDGCGLPNDCNWPQEGNLGARIVRDLAGRLDAEMDVQSDSGGTQVNLQIPKSALMD